MNIGLIDVDGHNFPNFALMRASAYHKTKGDQVEWATPFSRYDKVMASKVFTFTPDFNYLTLQAGCKSKKVVPGIKLQADFLKQWRTVH